MSTTVVVHGYNDWVVTDDDNWQCVKENKSDPKHGTYWFMQGVEIDEDNYRVISDEINIYDYVDVDNDYAYEFLIDVLGFFGYGMTIIRGDMDDKEYLEHYMKEFKDTYGKSWKRILAECIFEYQADISSPIAKNLTYKEMIDFITESMKNT